MARDAGERAVEKALKPPEPPRYSEAASNPRAEMWGRQAVGDALAPDAALFGGRPQTRAPKCGASKPSTRRPPSPASST